MASKHFDMLSITDRYTLCQVYHHQYCMDRSWEGTWQPCVVPKRIPGLPWKVRTCQLIRKTPCLKKCSLGTATHWEDKEDKSKERGMKEGESGREISFLLPPATMNSCWQAVSKTALDKWVQGFRAKEVPELQHKLCTYTDPQRIKGTWVLVQVWARGREKKKETATQSV